MDRFVCIHCHFYQPPRENPWLEAVEVQDSAEPYHDWNERVTAECYRPNAHARILDEGGRIRQIVNNYSSISFNFGPTLLSWLEEKAPDTYGAILEADRESRATRSGHGNALAQVYNHIIMPLANPRDRHTSVVWGIRDFQERFGRDPEGMWLSETAADLDTLEALADNGIRFTVLAPHQARGVRKLGHGGKFRNVEGAKIDPTRAYLLKLPSGRTINLFFYDGPVSQAVAFEKLLDNGESFAKRILGGFSDTREWTQLMHIATDGETYGHHHRFGEMALAFALQYIESQGQAKLTNYGEFLEKYPPTHEVEIINNTSWSCAHGVERWRSDCGCNTGGNSDWTQVWRAPLRAALDSLRDELTPMYERAAAQLLRDPWGARAEYIGVILDRSAESVEAFFRNNATRELNHEERVRALQLLEMQRHALLMYTSCGWFFSELSGIETVQVIMYAGRALQLAQELFGDGVEQRFLDRLAVATSNIPEHGNGAQIYEKWVKPARIDLPDVGAHYAISSLFDSREQLKSIFCYDVDVKQERRSVSGSAQLALGQIRVHSRITTEEADLTYGVLRFGDHNVSAGIRRPQGEKEFMETAANALGAFQAADLPGTLRALDRQFEGTSYSLRALFKDEQRKVLGQILRSTMEEVESAYGQVYEHHASLIDFFGEVGAPIPPILRHTSEFVLNARIRHAFAVEDPIPVGELRSVIQTAERERVTLGINGIAFVISRRLKRMSAELPDDLDAATLDYLNEVIALVRELPFDVDLTQMQDRVYEYLTMKYPEHAAGDENEWVRQFAELCDRLKLRLPGVSEEAEASLRAG
jgi:alpha-amylase/alpha-mannosidase (GH57 family)